ncbi:MAG: aminotransferase class I/II-fold pyridoxal phosphate-dependent enzyme [Myxococcota bacterium]|nr:aminotransferase class I/II-fold pyridoxal phosphate-dependent enzyme [Myxococcota bacterium]
MEQNHPTTSRRGVQPGAGAAAIAADVEARIRDGQLAAGERLPTVRALAAELGVSPATVSAAYRRLRRRGLLVGEGRRGTSVRPAPALRTAVSARLPRGALDLATGNPDPELLPPLGPALRRIEAAHHLYADSHALPALQRRAARQLAADGIPSDHLTVVSGALDGMERVLEAHLRPGDAVALEDPGFSNVIDLVAALGLEPLPVALDDRGLLPEALAAALAAGARALVATPRAQNPTGAAFDAPRARALRRVLQDHPQVLLVEDDHAGIVSGAAAFSLADSRRERWAVVRSVSKMLGPDLRLALLAGDADTVARVEGRQRIGFRWVSHLLQRLVVALEADRATAGRLRRAARTYAARRDALLGALAARGIEASGRSGLNVWVPVPAETPVVQALAAAGYAVAAGERFRIQAPPAVRITTAALDPARAPDLAEALAAALGAGSRSAAS